MTNVSKLPEGIHQMSLKDIERLFVDSAPFSEARMEIWDRFEHYTTLLSTHLPGTVLYVDGRFTVWDESAPPHDIDFVAVVDFFAWAGLTGAARDRLKHIREESDVLDAHFIPEWDARGLDLWLQEFSRYRDADHRRVPGVYKGIIEVTL